MKVIFIKNLKGQGKINDIKDVSDGYATNYLIKNGYAVKYTKTSLDRLNQDIENNKIKEAENIKNATIMKNKLENIVITFEVKEGSNGKIFGNISSKQIVEKLSEKGYEIDKKKISLDTQLNSVGTHIVNIELYKGVVAELKVILKEK